jgi:drug/metabolite transporter (DMT)-like permease
MLLFRAYKKEQISKLEPIIAMEPLFVIILAVIFSFIFGEELFKRDVNIIIPGIIAGLALVLSRVKKHHLNFRKYSLYALGAVALFALDLVFSRILLEFYSPITFYFVRCSLIFVIGAVFLKPRLSKIDKKSMKYLFVSAFFWVFYRFIVYYGYQGPGVIFTTLLIMLGPIFIFILAHFMLKEKLNWKNIAASLIVVASVLYASFEKDVLMFFQGIFG